MMFICVIIFMIIQVLYDEHKKMTRVEKAGLVSYRCYKNKMAIAMFKHKYAIICQW